MIVSIPDLCPLSYLNESDGSGETVHTCMRMSLFTGYTCPI